MTIPTEPIVSIPGPLPQIHALTAKDRPDPEPLCDQAIRDTLACFEATGSPVITDGEERKHHDFWTSCATDDCGFWPFCDDTTTRDTVFATIRARLAGTTLAAETLGGR